MSGTMESIVKMKIVRQIHIFVSLHLFFSGKYLMQDQVIKVSIRFSYVFQDLLLRLLRTKRGESRLTFVTKMVNELPVSTAQETKKPFISPLKGYAIIQAPF